MKIGKTFWWILGLAVASGLAALLPGISNNKIFLRLVLTWGMILLVGILWSVLSIIGIRAFRRARILRMQVGQTFVERYDILNQSFLPKAWVKIIDESDLPGSEGSRIITNIKAHESRSFNTYSQLTRRGLFQLGPTRIETGDMLGIFSLSRVFDIKSRLMVLPYFFEIGKFPAPFGFLTGGRALKVKTTEVTPYSSGVREYMPGDPLRRIHWPISARKNTLIVKEFEKDPLAEVWIFLDALRDVHVEKPEAPGNDSRWSFLFQEKRRKYSLPPSTFEYATCLAASIARYYINQRRDVGLSINAKRYSLLTPDRGERQLVKIFDNLALISADGTIPLKNLINAQVSSLVKGSTAIVITVCVDNEIMEIFHALYEHGIGCVMILIDGESFGGRSIAKEMERELRNLNVITYRIEYGADLASVLQMGSFGHNYVRKLV